MAHGRMVIYGLAAVLAAVAAGEAPAALGSPAQWPTQTVATRDYFPLQAGDRRLYVYPNNDVRDERTAGPINLDGHQVWAFSSTGHGPDSVYYYEDTEGATYLHGFDEDMAVRFFPDRLLLASAADQAAAWHCEGAFTVDGIGGLSYSFDMTVQGVGVACSTPAGVFPDCLVIRFVGWMGLDPDVDYFDEVWYLARDVGLVKVSNAINPGESFELLCARVGGREYGVLPPSAGDFNSDGRVSTNDAALLLEAYLGAPYSIELDIYPYDGTLPEIIPRPDGSIDDGDLATFLQIWPAYHPPAFP